MFTPNRKFRRDYDHLFRKDPEAANLMLLLCELADKNGQVATDEKELAMLFNARFADPQEYSI